MHIMHVLRCTDYNIIIALHVHVYSIIYDIIVHHFSVIRTVSQEL